MTRRFVRLKEEILKLLPPAIFFFIALHVVAFVRVLMLRGTGIAVGTSVSVTVAALILAKAVLIADLLPFINRFPHRPLVYNVLWKTAIYALVAMLVHYAERLVEFSRRAGGVAAGNRKLIAEIIWPHFFAIQILMVVLILMYCSMRELVRVIGAARVRQLFFGPLPAEP